MIEKGIKLAGLTPSRLRAGGALGGALEKFDRFYLGAEFCENLLPPPGELCRTVEFFLRKRRKVCVVTPPVTERGVKVLRETFRLLAGLRDKTMELTINDFGALELSRGIGLAAKVNAGRLLYDNIFMIRKNTIRLINAHAARFFTSQGINRFEISATGSTPKTNFDKADSLGFSPAKLNFTLYYPFLNMTSTRTCLLGTPDIPPHESVGAIACGRECEVASFEVRHPLIKEKLLVRGNTIFRHFPRKFYSSEKTLAAMRVNRLVYCPFP